MAVRISEISEEGIRDDISITESIPKIAKTARIIPTIPSPAIIPEQKSVPFVMVSSFFAFENLSSIYRITAPIAMHTLKLEGKYIPIAKGREGILRISAITERKTPVNTKIQGS